jgi:ribonuclease Z
MTMQLIFLGTGAMVPTKDRNHTAVFFRYQTEGILFDCGEGTQRQLRIEGIKPTAVTRIILSHWDGDHVLGLPGLIQTLAMSEENKHLVVHGPKGTEERFKHLFRAFEFYNKIDLDIKEYDNGTVYESEDLMVVAHELEHKVLTFGFEIIEKDRRRIMIEKAKALHIPEGPMLGRLQRGESVTNHGKRIDPDDVSYIVPGKKIGLIADTRLCPNCLAIAKDKDVVICDSTFEGKEEEKAFLYFHMTCIQAAQLAQQANAKKLILTHFSQRYKEVQGLEQEARDIFPNTVAAYDFMKVKL